MVSCRLVQQDFDQSWRMEAVNLCVCGPVRAAVQIPFITPPCLNSMQELILTLFNFYLRHVQICISQLQLKKATFHTSSSYVCYPIVLPNNEAFLKLGFKWKTYKSTVDLLNILNPLINSNGGSVKLS